MACPLRKLWHNPRKILRGHVTEGMTTLDIGCGMGFFSVPLAEMVGPAGKVVCIDMQQAMIDALAKRARKAQLADRIDMRTCSLACLGIDDLADQVDFALSFAVVHETREQDSLFAEVYQALKPGGEFLLAEPKACVSAKEFEATISRAGQRGFRLVDRIGISSGRGALLEK